MKQSKRNIQNKRLRDEARRDDPPAISKYAAKSRGMTTEDAIALVHGVNRQAMAGFGIDLGYGEA